MPSSRRLTTPCLLSLYALFAANVAGGQGSLPPPSSGPPPPIGNNAPAVSAVERIGDGVFRIGQVTIDKKQRVISFPARVNMAEGLVEYLLVRTSGKTHESLLRTDSEPYDVQLACLLLDLNGTDRPLPFQGAPELPRGDRVTVQVMLADGKPFDPERWLAKVVDGQKSDVAGLDWVYTGSWVNYGRFMAQIDGSIIALFHDPVAIVDNASPGGESDKIWFVKEGATPPVGTPVTVTLRLKPTK